MAIFEFGPDKFCEIAETTFGKVGIKERGDLQRFLRGQIEIISRDTLIIAEEFCDWEDSQRRIDLLGVDKNANLIVIELKRTEDGGHMELQALRYAAMVSTMTFEKVVDVFAAYLKDVGRLEEDPQTLLLHFLKWDEPNEEAFAQDVKIILVSAEFSKELTTAVLWLNDRDLDIRCIRIKPYDDNGRILVDVQQVIPLPEATEYQVQIKEKQQREKVARKTLDRTKYDVMTAGTRHERLPKNRAIFTVVKFLCDNGEAPEAVHTASGDGREWFQVLEETLNSEGFAIPAEKRPRCFCADGELIHSAGKTYAFTNQWGLDTFTPAIDNLLKAYPDRKISVAKSS